jgi:hypothetical protein
MLRGFPQIARNFANLLLLTHHFFVRFFANGKISTADLAEPFM